MKTKYLISVFVLVISISIAGINRVNAQELGLRFGDALGMGNNVAIDGVFAFGEFNRLHADVNFGNGVGVEVLWDFIYRPLGGEAFYWYVGAGASLFLGDPFILGVAGEIGLEYHFNSVPIALGADWRPVLIIIEDTDFETGGFGLNVRWVFSE